MPITLQKRYDAMWSSAARKIQNGAVQVDPILAAGVVDDRRGMTLIARPSKNVREKVGTFVRELRQLEPDQYYYSAPDLHVTVLALFSATVEHASFFDKAEKYVSVTDSVLKSARPFAIEFAGVTASPGAVVIQGFPRNDELNGLRDALRRKLRRGGLAARLDLRYRLETAHMTIVRIRASLRNAAKFAAALNRSRQRSFGTTDVRELALVKNDWYMNHRLLEKLKHYRLPSRT